VLAEAVNDVAEHLLSIRPARGQGHAINAFTEPVEEAGAAPFAFVCGGVGRHVPQALSRLAVSSMAG